MTGKADRLPRYREIIQLEAAKTEVTLAVGRVITLTVFLLTDCLLWQLGESRAGYQVPAAALGVEAAFIGVAIAILGLVHRFRLNLPVWPRYLITLNDFLFVGSYAACYTSGTLPPDMILGMTGMTAMLLVILCAFRFDHLVTAFGGVLAVLTTSGLGLLVQAAAGMNGAISLTVAVVGALATFLSWRYRAVVRHVVERSKFERFLPRQVVEQFIRGRDEAELGGREIEVTVLFTDIRGFTTLCESMRPLEVLDLLNDFFTAVSAVIFRHSGMLDKFVGDSVMAVFGAPLNQRDDATRAVRCAREIREVVARINAERAGRQQPAIGFSIGLHTGIVVAGNLGSPERMEYTVIGDTVNVAARVEGLTRQLDTDILVTESTREAAGNAGEFIPKGEVTVRNRTTPLHVYAVA